MHMRSKCRFGTISIEMGFKTLGQEGGGHLGTVYRQRGEGVLGPSSVGEDMGRGHVLEKDGVGHMNSAGTLSVITGGTARVVLRWVGWWFGGREMRDFRWSDCTKFSPGSTKHRHWCGEVGRQRGECRRSEE